MVRPDRARGRPGGASRCSDGCLRARRRPGAVVVRNAVARQSRVVKRYVVLRSDGASHRQFRLCPPAIMRRVRFAAVKLRGALCPQPQMGSWRRLGLATNSTARIWGNTTTSSLPHLRGARVAATRSSASSIRRRSATRARIGDKQEVEGSLRRIPKSGYAQRTRLAPVATIFRLRTSCLLRICPAR